MPLVTRDSRAAWSVLGDARPHRLTVHHEISYPRVRTGSFRIGRSTSADDDPCNCGSRQDVELVRTSGGGGGAHLWDVIRWSVGGRRHVRLLGGWLGAPPGHPAFPWPIPPVPGPGGPRRGTGDGPKRHRVVTGGGAVASPVPVQF